VYEEMCLYRRSFSSLQTPPQSPSQPKQRGESPVPPSTDAAVDRRLELIEKTLASMTESLASLAGDKTSPMKKETSADDSEEEKPPAVDVCASTEPDVEDDPVDEEDWNVVRGRKRSSQVRGSLTGSYQEPTSFLAADKDIFIAHASKEVKDIMAHFKRMKVGAWRPCETYRQITAPGFMRITECTSGCGSAAGQCNLGRNSGFI
jgi:hypothetical protein